VREVELLGALEGRPLVDGDGGAGQQGGVRRVQVAVTGQRLRIAGTPVTFDGTTLTGLPTALKLI